MYTASRDKFKISKKQARRIYEILRLKFTPKFDEQQMKLYRLDIKNRLNAPHKNENLRKKRVMAQVSETVSEEDRKRHLQSEYEDIVGEYDKVITRLNRF
jgi:histone acetyltransferase 1